MISETHGLLIAASYLVSFAAIGALAVAIALDHRRQKRALESLERLAGPDGRRRP